MASSPLSSASLRWTAAGAALASLCVPVLGAINPDPEFRVLSLGWVQEPASALFSLVGSLVHLYQWRVYQETTTPRKYPFYLWVVGYHYLWMFTGFSAFMFHVIETGWNEAMDYYGVLMAIYWGIWHGIVRVFRIERNWPACIASGVPLLLIVAHTMGYMMFTLFDYGYHQKVCALGLGVHAALWIALHVKERQAHTAYMVYAHIMLGVCSLFEIIDFKPLLQTFDGHSLWHLAAVVAARVFFYYIIGDARQSKSSVR